MRKDKAIYMGKDEVSGEAKKPWTDKYKCPNCGHWNLVTKDRCDHCGHREKPVEE